MMNNSGYSYGDLVAMTRNNGDRDNNLFGEDLLIILFLIFIMNGGRFNGYGGNGAESALTRAEMMDGFNFNQLDNGIRSIERGMSDGFSNQNVAMLQGFNSVTREIDQSRFDMQNCCCQTQRLIDRNQYEAQKNTCDIITSGNLNTRDIIEAQHNDTQRILDYMVNKENQDLRMELQSAQLALQNNAQTQTLIDNLRPCPVPAYPSCSPYQVSNWGCGCGNNNNCFC